MAQLLPQLSLYPGTRDKAVDIVVAVIVMAVEQHAASCRIDAIPYYLLARNRDLLAANTSGKTIALCPILIDINLVGFAAARATDIRTHQARKPIGKWRAFSVHQQHQRKSKRSFPNGHQTKPTPQRAKSPSARLATRTQNRGH